MAIPPSSRDTHTPALRGSELVPFRENDEEFDFKPTTSRLKQFRRKIIAD
jgi:hypothetical protein